MMIMIIFKLISKHTARPGHHSPGVITATVTVTMASHWQSLQLSFPIPWPSAGGLVSALRSWHVLARFPGRRMLGALSRRCGPGTSPRAGPVPTEAGGPIGQNGQKMLWFHGSTFTHHAHIHDKIFRIYENQRLS